MIIDWGRNSFYTDAGLHQIDWKSAFWIHPAQVSLTLPSRSLSLTLQVRTTELIAGTWARRIKLTIDNTDIDDSLSGFPILVYLSASSGRNNGDVSCVFDELESDANRKKIAVVTSNGYTQCYVEIEKWDDANEEAWLWVKVPSVASGADTDLYLYYDKTKADNTDYVGDTNSTPAENVWDSNFKLVCHMSDDPDTSHLRDSTDTDGDLTKVAANQPLVTTSGQIADAQDHDGLDDVAISAALAPLQVGTGDFTISIWVNLDTVGGAAQNIVRLSYNTGVANDYRSAGFFEQGGAIYAHSRTAAGVEKTAANAIAATTWYRLTVVRISEVVYGYINGVAMTTTGTAGADFDYSSGGKVYIGAGDNDAGGAAYFTEGIIDEVRYSSTGRLATWIKASYESERDDLLGFGSEETGAYGGIKAIALTLKTRSLSLTLPTRD